MKLALMTRIAHRRCHSWLRRPLLRPTEVQLPRAGQAQPAGTCGAA